MAEVRTERDRLWRPLREHLLNGAALQAPAEAIAGYESGVAAADDRADARFASADASGKLSLLEQTRASHDLTRSEEHTSELQSLMRISHAVFCLKKTNHHNMHTKTRYNT